MRGDIRMPEARVVLMLSVDLETTQRPRHPSVIPSCAGTLVQPRDLPRTLGQSRGALDQPLTSDMQ